MTPIQCLVLASNITSVRRMPSNECHPMNACGAQATGPRDLPGLKTNQAAAPIAIQGMSPKNRTPGPRVLYVRLPQPKAERPAPGGVPEGQAPVMRDAAARLRASAGRYNVAWWQDRMVRRRSVVPCCGPAGLRRPSGKGSHCPRQLGPVPGGGYHLPEARGALHSPGEPHGLRLYGRKLDVVL